MEILIPEEFIERHREGFKRFSSTGRAGLIGNVMEVEGLKKDGSRFSVEMSRTSLKINGWYATAVVRDITGRKNSRLNLRGSLRRRRG